jgi:hypothetical protein
MQPQLFCKNTRDTMTTIRAINAATEWMLSNGFKDEDCVERSRSASKIRYIPPEPTGTSAGTRFFARRSCECRST